MRRGRNKGMPGIRCTRRELRALGMVGPSPHAYARVRDTNKWNGHGTPHALLKRFRRELMTLVLGQFTMPSKIPFADGASQVEHFKQMRERLHAAMGLLPAKHDEPTT